MPFETKKNENGTAIPCKLLKGAAQGKMQCCDDPQLCCTPQTK